MLLHERLSAERRPINVKILATDGHRTSLEVASAGVYSEEQVAGITPERLERFFTRKANGYHIAQALRETIVFAPHNLIRDAPFTKLDLVTCRNLLIYFQPHAQKTVLTLFHFCLKPGGFLFLGSSETPGALLDEFDTIDEHGKMYRKRRHLALPHDLKLPLARSAAASRRSCWRCTTGCSIGSCRRVFSSRPMATTASRAASESTAGANKTRRYSGSRSSDAKEGGRGGFTGRSTAAVAALECAVAALRRGFGRRRSPPSLAAFRFATDFRVFAALAPGSGGRLFVSRRSRSRTNALSTFSAARASRSVRCPLK